MPESHPLSPDQQQQLTAAGERAAKILAAAKVATFNGWTIGAFAVISLLFAFGSLTALVMGIGLAWIAWNEFQGRARLRAFDQAAAAFLGKNQLVLLGLIATYALVSIYRTLTQPIPHLAEIEEMVGPVGELVTSVSVGAYVAVLVLTVIFQGVNARYYFARQKMIEKYLAETAAWIVELQRKVGE